MNPMGWMVEILLHFNTIVFRIKWKNNPPPKNEAYRPTSIEHSANILSHGVCVLFMTLLNSMMFTYLISKIFILALGSSNYMVLLLFDFVSIYTKAIFCCLGLWLCTCRTFFCLYMFSYDCIFGKK